MAREKGLARRERATELEPFEAWNTFQEMERMFRDFFASPLPMFRRHLMMPEMRREIMPEVDLKETEQDLVLTASVPGLEKDDIDINVTGDRITISGERKTEEEKPEERYHIRQQSYGMFRSSYALPVEVKPDEVKATYRNGVLEVTMPKAEVTQEHKVKVEEVAD